MPALPPIAEFTAPAVTEGGFKTALTALRACLAGLLGDTGVPADALATLGALFGGLDARTGASAVTAADRGKTLLASGTWALTLPTAAGVGAGFAVTLVNDGAGVITVTRSGGDTIDGATTAAAGPGRAAVLVSTGSAWITLGLAGTLAGRTLLADGTAAAPALTFASDPDTGLIRPGADQIGLVTAGALRVLMSATEVQINLPVTGTAAQGAVDDATAGRLLKVGAFGLGGVTVTAENWDAASVTGFLRNTTTGAVGVPSAAVNWLGLHIHINANNAAQIAFRAGAVLVRWKFSGLWSAWDSLCSRATLLGAVSQSAGVPTGAVIERGSNANGDYVRFADGTQICTITTLSAPNASTARGSLFRSADLTWTYPAAFSAAPVIAGGADTADAWLAHAAPGTTSVALRALAAVNTATAIPLRATATGRWF
ncbi:MAG: hypothetical protein Q7J57_05480 [Gemmobacter sp.]|nr:hypothetical protein [Gemmobacter sp.]